MIGSLLGRRQENEMKALTKKMEQALIAVAYGVRKYDDGYRSVETREKVDGRSLEALYRRELIDWRTTGGSTGFVELNLTEAGDELFEEKLRYRITLDHIT